MKPLRGGLLLGAGLAVGIVVGAAGSVFASSPTPHASVSATPTPAAWSQLLGGSGMMTGTGMMRDWASGGSPGATFGPSMMGSLDPASRAALLKACDAMHDAMHHDAGTDGAPPAQSTP